MEIFKFNLFAKRYFPQKTLILLAWLGSLPLQGQTNLVTYAGGTGREVLYETVQLSDSTFLVCGYAEDLDWIASDVPRTVLGMHDIKNGAGTNKIGFILQLSKDLQSIRHVVHFPPGAVEDIRHIKTSNIPGQTTDQIYISGNTSDTRANNGGYFIGKLNNNFVTGVPSNLSWAVPLWAEGYPKQYHPWDVGNDGKVVYIFGQSHNYQWAEANRLNADGIKEVVPNWRYHKLTTGKEYKGKASDAPDGTGSLSYSSIIFKRWGRCDLRSWTQADYELEQADENGGTKKGKWPLDAFFAGPCDPEEGSGPSGAGYTGYSMGNTPVYGPSAVTIDRRNNHIYIGMNVKTVFPDGSPDIEPAVIAMDQAGTLKWWSRLYHEITPTGKIVNSSPDQYVDGFAVDYSQPVSTGSLVVLARCHGNNVENFWEGNTIAANPGSSGFQNRFTGRSGNIHLSWLGKLNLDSGILRNSTYLGEYNEGSNSYGKAHPDAHLDGWPDPNNGWPNLNSTRCKDVAVASDGAICVTCTGRKTITTRDAYQKNVKPGKGTSPWNSFVRVYKSDLSVPIYSSLLTGAFDPSEGSGGNNTELYGVLPVSNHVLVVGKHKEDKDNAKAAAGNPIATTQIPDWGSDTPSGESLILGWLALPTTNSTEQLVSAQTAHETNLLLTEDLLTFPNPVKNQLHITFQIAAAEEVRIELHNALSQSVSNTMYKASTGKQTLTLPVRELTEGLYLLTITGKNFRTEKKVIVTQ